MKKRRGYIKTINGSHFWYDVNDNPHRLDEMDENYIKNCLSLLDKRSQAALKNNIIFDQHLDVLLFQDELNYRELVKSTSVGRLIYA